jgi:hypothetical protein
MECHAGQAWVGIRVQLGHEAGLQIPKNRNKNTPSRQRRRARRASARGEQDRHAEEVVGQDHHLAEEPHETDQPCQNEAAKAGKCGKAGECGKAVEVIPVTPVDKFCSNEEFDGNILSDENSVTESKEIFSFKSDFAEEDIEKCLDEILKTTKIKSTKIIHRDQLGSVYLYTLELKIEKGKLQKTSFSWPQMSTSQMKVFQNLKRIL